LDGHSILRSMLRLLTCELVHEQCGQQATTPGLVDGRGFDAAGAPGWCTWDRDSTARRRRPFPNALALSPTGQELGRRAFSSSTRIAHRLLGNFLSEADRTCVCSKLTSRGLTSPGAQWPGGGRTRAGPFRIR